MPTAVARERRGIIEGFSVAELLVWRWVRGGGRLPRRYEARLPFVHRVPQVSHNGRVRAERARRRYKTDKDMQHTERRRFEQSRVGETSKVVACGWELYVTVNKFADGKPGEVFVKVGKEGSTVSGFLNALCVTISVALQHGTPWDAIHRNLEGTRFAPGDRENPSLVHALSAAIDTAVKR